MIDTQQPFEIGDITVYPKTDEMSCNGKTIEVKSMAMKMICFFASHHDEVITRKNLRDSIWHNSNASDHTINNHMYGLRQIFATFDDKAKYFHTVTGSKSGYRLLAKVSQVTPVLGDVENNKSLENNDKQKTIDINKPVTKLNLASFSSNYKSVLLIVISIIIISGILLSLFEQYNYDKISPLTSMAGREQNPAISQDGSILLYAHRSSRESTWELYASRLSASSKIVETNKIFSNSSRNENYISISPNKKLIAFIRYPKDERGIYLADFDEVTLSATNERLIIPLKTMNLSPVISWLSDTTFFYNATEAISAPRKIFEYNLIKNTSEPISAPPLNTFGDFASAVSPNQKWLAIMRSDESFGYQLFLYDLDKKILIPTDVKNDKDRLNISFSDSSEEVYFIDNNGFLSSYHISEEKIKLISSLVNPGYWPLKIPGKQQFIIQQDWGLSSLTNQIIKVNNPLVGGDGKSKVIVDNGLSIRSITELGNNGLLFSSITANQDVELWKYQRGEITKLDAFNNIAHQHAYLSLHWLKNSDKAMVSINNTCHLIDINTGKDTPLCPANERLYAGRFSKNGQSIYLVGDYNNTSRTVKMGMSGYPLTPILNIDAANSIQEGELGDFYYSHEPSFDIYHYNAKAGKSIKIIDRTFVIEEYSNNDFVITKTGIYFMDRKKVRENAIYYYSFKTKSIDFVIPTKDNYPHLVVSEDEKSIYLIQSYDNNSKLSLIGEK
jgi:DNA-binding winged helix-turn-helix (wHTH) protein